MATRWGAAVAAVMMAAIPVGADPDPAPPAALQALVASTGYQGYVARIFAGLPPALFQRCPGLRSPGSRVIVLAPVRFAPDGYPTAGRWLQQFPVSGCGNDTTINIVFDGHPDEKITSTVAVPGATHANLVLQRDALRFVTIAIQAVARGCTDVTVRDSRYDGVAEAGGRAWRESWAATACGTRVRVPLTFIPDATGTTIRASPAVRVD